MAKKKIKPIVSLCDEEKLTVQKSLPLFSLWQSKLTLAEFKILDTYLSRINSRNLENRTVIFEKGELEKLLGVKRIRMEELDERLKNLGTPVRIDDVTSKNKKFSRISLFEKAIAEQDDYGFWKVELTSSVSAMKYIFNIEQLGYLRYKLRCITSLTSRYTYIMFIYLEANRYRKSWEVSVEELRKILACDTEETYKEYKHFNNLILKKIYKEMHKKTECKYMYEPIKKGKYVVAIRFTVFTLSEIVIEEPKQLTVEKYISAKNNRDDICHGFSSDEFSNFSEEELRLLKDLAWDKKDGLKVEQHMSLLNNRLLACEYAVSDYLRTKIFIAKTREPKNLFLYVKKMIKND